LPDVLSNAIDCLSGQQDTGFCAVYLERLLL